MESRMVEDFGLAGLYEQDEEVEMVDLSPMKEPSPRWNTSALVPTHGRRTCSWVV